MKRNLAFVLGGGGSRGAMQVGALRALLEGGYIPDMVTGTSIGAVNGAFFAVNGYTLQGVEKATRVWQAIASEDLMPINKWWETARAFFRHSEGIAQSKIRDFATDHGLKPDLFFRDLSGVMLYLVATDMNSGRPIIYGKDSAESILESMLTSMALPPWMAPFEQEGQFLVDGGLVSNLPIETALNLGATEIIALDLFDPTEVDLSLHGVSDLINKLYRTVIDRQLQLELQLAEARGVHVRHIKLIADPSVQIWDFSRSLELIEHGYDLTLEVMATWPVRKNPKWLSWKEIKSRLDGLLVDANQTK